MGCKKTMKILKQCEIKMSDESTILVLKKRNNTTYIVYDICGEDINSDGDGTYAEFDNLDSALEFYKNEKQLYLETYQDIVGVENIEVIDYA